MKKKIFVILVIVFLFVTVVLLVKSKNNKITINYHPYFLSNKFNINTFVDKDVTLSFMYVDDKKNLLIKKLIDNPRYITLKGIKNVEIKQVKVIEGSEYRDIKLYNFILKVKFNKSGSFKFNRLDISNLLNLNNNSIYVGDILINVEDVNTADVKDKNKLVIMEHSAQSPKLNYYFAKYVNNSNKPIKIIDIETGSFLKYISNISIQSNNKIINDTTKYLLKPKEELIIKIKFQETDKFDIYCFNPLIKYQYKDNTNIISEIPIYTIYKTAFNETQMNKLYNYYKKVCID